MKTRTTVRIPEAMRLAMQKQIIADGYGLRGKSRWVVEAIEHFLKLKDFQDYVDIADEMTNLTSSDVFQLPVELKCQLDDALVAVRKCYPKLEGVQSCIIRSSIIQRLLRSKAS